MKHCITIFLFLFFGFNSQGQEQPEKFSDKTKEFLADYSRGVTADFQVLKHQSVSIGFTMMHPPEHCDLIGKGLIFNNELIFNNDKNDFLYSPQLSAFYSFIYFYGGLKFSYYTNFKDGGNFIIAPEVGIGYFFIFLTYSRNISITDNNFVPVNKDNVSLKLLVPLELLGVY